MDKEIALNSKMNSFNEVSVVFKFMYNGKQYGFMVNGERTFNGGDEISVNLPEEETEKLLTSLFSVVDRKNIFPK